MILLTLTALLLFGFLGDTASSCSLVLCSDENYGAPCHTYNPALYGRQYASLGSYYKYYSSAYFQGSGCVAHLYHENNYGRFERTLYSNAPSFPALEFNDALASLKVVDTTCGAGYYFHSSAHYNSYGCTACPAGTWKDSTTGCSWGSTCTYQCNSCPAGTYSSAGSSSCTPCPAGEYQPNSGSTHCHACAAGSYTAGRGSTSCNACPAGQYITVQGYSYCVSCPVGMYQNLRGQTSCSNCPVGSYASGYGSQNCAVCPIGTYSDVGGSGSCKKCAPRKYGLTNGAISESAGCGFCPAGTYQPSDGATTCLTCPAGKVSAEGSLECTECPAGSFANAISTTCDLCPEGTHQPLAGQTQCTPCTAGEISAEGALECTPCPSGTYPDVRSGSCQPCHDNLIGFDKACYGTMDFETCPATAEVGECEFDSQDDSFELLPGCELATITAEIVANVVRPEEYKFGANKIELNGFQLDANATATDDVNANVTANNDNATHIDEGKVLIKCSAGNIVPTSSPTVSPSFSPSTNPTVDPTFTPSVSPSSSPSFQPTVAPSQAPTSAQPTSTPSTSPTTSDPSTSPSSSPTFQPTVAPSQAPTTARPTNAPNTSQPSQSPSIEPSSAPTSAMPTMAPTFTTSPTVSPTIAPSITEVLTVAESDKQDFLTMLLVGLGSAICCIGLVAFAFLRKRKVSEETAKRSPVQSANDVENQTGPESPLVTDGELEKSWEVKIME